MIEKYVVLTAADYAAILTDLDTVRRIWCNGRPAYPEIFKEGGEGRDFSDQIRETGCPSAFPSLPN